mmetsp:Transcript_9914/g.21085  ORF Transcript_9914/g.21085 Transcript_9914/m.21085 type:complete len:804 (-) Transcript_9914:654-3065(-)
MVKSLFILTLGTGVLATTLALIAASALSKKRNPPAAKVQENARRLDTAIISVPLSPFSISLYLASDGPEVWTENDLKVFSAAAIEFLDGDNLLMRSLDLEGSANGSGLEYKRAKLTARLPSVVGGQRDRELEQSLLRTNISTRREVQKEDKAKTTIVNLGGSIKFSVPREMDPLDSGVPTDEDLSGLVRSLFVAAEDEGTFISIVKSVAQREGDSSTTSWLVDLEGYRTLDEYVAVREVATSYANMDQLQSNDGADSISSKNDENNSINIFIIIGAAGVGLSLILLLGGLCYAKRKSIQENKNMTKNDQFRHEGDGSPKMKKSMLSRNSSKSNDQTPPPPPPPPPTLPMDPIDSNPPPSYDETDDESNADFLLARQALNSNRSRGVGGGASVVSNANTYTDDMSYAFSVDADSIAAATKASGMDDAIGAGGIASFQNEKGGTFRWNEEGTKMVYIPAAQNNGDGRTVDNKDGREQNGFVFDDEKKKWVVLDKNISFDPTTSNSSSGNSSALLVRPNKVQRSRTDDTEGAQSYLTGVSEFSYDDVALDFARRTRSDASASDTFEMSAMSLNQDNGGEDVDDCGVDGAGDANGPYSPGVEEEGVEVTAPESFAVSNTYREAETISEEFVPNSNFEDDSTAFASVLTGFSSKGPVPVTPERDIPRNKYPVQTQTTISRNPSIQSSDPGVIRPIQEEAPFDEDIPFDEMPRRINKQQMQPQQSSQRITRDDSYVKANHVKIPKIMDDDSYSSGSVNSAEVLQDLNALNRFMSERKRSSKSSHAQSVGRIPSFGRKKSSRSSGIGWNH